MNRRIKPGKRLKCGKPDAPAVPNIPWPQKIMADRPGDGHQFRQLCVLDDFNRERSGIEVDFSLPAERMIRSLARLKQQNAWIERLGRTVRHEWQDQNIIEPLGVQSRHLMDRV